MNDSIKLKLIDSNGVEIITLTDAVSLNFTKDFYTPYTYIKATFVCSEDLSAVTCCELSVAGHTVHRGPVLELKTRYQNGELMFFVVSKGTTFMLLENELSEGLLSNPSLNLILDTKKHINGIYHQDLSETVNYIYVSEKAVVWEVLTNLCLKQYSSCPFIKGINKVCFTNDASSTFTHSDIIETGRGRDYSKAISACYMKDTENVYSYIYTDAEVEAKGIVKELYLNLDRQWLADSVTGLKYRVDYSLRGCEYEFIRYCGFMGEDILDKVLLNGTPSDISRIGITYGRNGLVTTLYFYKDRYCNKQA